MMLDATHGRGSSPQGGGWTTLINVATAWKESKDNTVCVEESKYCT